VPVHVEKRGDGYVIIEDSTGKVKGHSKSRRSAEISAAIRNKAIQNGLVEGFTKEAVINNINWFEAHNFTTPKAVCLALFFATGRR